MTKRFKKSTLCIMMSLLILATSFATNAITSRAASPYWGAAYLDSGKKSVTVSIDVTSSVKAITLKSWDFSSDVVFYVNVYSPSGKELDMSILFGSNDEKAGKIYSCSEKGTYTVVYNVATGTAGGWVGAWLY
jgi:hypothetical protein